MIPKLDRKKQILLFAAVIFLNIIILGKPYYFSLILRDFVLILAVFLSIKAYILFLDKNKNFHLFVRTFALPVIYVLFNTAGIILLFLLSLIIEGDNIYYLPRVILINAELAVLVGIGLGMGFDLWAFINMRTFKMKLHN